MTAAYRPAVALAAAACALLGTAAVALAVFAGPAPELTSYVSEAGASDSTTIWAYRIGLLATAAGQVLLGAALPAVLRLATGLLAASAVATVVSAGVSCRAACPLPPFDRVTLADLVHGGASIAAVAGTVFAMLAVAGTTGVARPLRRISVSAAAVALPLSAVAGLTLLLVGRSVLMGAVERLLLLDLAAWGVVTALTLGLARAPAALNLFQPEPRGAHAPRPTLRSVGPRGEVEEGSLVGRERDAPPTRRPRRQL
ncbi:DUF998 domain-containing protein [Plantactinospora sp. KLBMP9567]|uniref:DUF998 domain-containing protein n=1 Tax=Plantactinospora sp. KLBMP9567 TaxID=3085900 RepID=UPI00298108C0|nr:DUF998 domain-containing protein [Plantactinospora sp. KLBMP9567]MDW5323974.1 DUF998 domain-containing protein [Plantactinospora sp. KLBMP9567]